MKKLLSIVLALLIVTSCICTVSVSASARLPEPDITPRFFFVSIWNAVYNTFSKVLATIKDFLFDSPVPPLPEEPKETQKLQLQQEPQELQLPQDPPFTPSLPTTSTLIAKSEAIVIDRVNGFVYGFTNCYQMLNEDMILNNYLTVTANGRLEIIPVHKQSYGTGTIINVYDSENNLTEKFVIIIFGDLNGDARTTSADIVIARDEALGKTSWSLPENASYNSERVKAADLIKDGVITSSDEAELRNVVLADYDIDQINGSVIYDY